MKNRQKLLKTNEYDVLLQMNKYLVNQCVDLCIIDLLENKTTDCPVNVKDCEDCISQWLNKEADK